LAVIGASTTAAVLAMAMPAPRRRADLRIITVGAAAFTASLAIASLSNDGPVTRAFLATLHIDGTTLALVALTAEAIVIAVCVPFVLKAVARPRPSRAEATPSARRQWLDMIPARFRRGFAISGLAAFTLTAFATSLVAVRALLTTQSNEAAITIALLPLVVGAVNVSGVARADAENRTLDILRLSSQPSVVAAIRMAGELWMPFVLSSAIVLIASQMFGHGPRFSSVAALALTVIWVAPFALLEGWHRAMLLTYIAPLAIIAFRLSGIDERMSFRGVVPYAALFWIGWAAAASILRHGIGVPFGWRLQSAALAAITYAGVSAGSGLMTQPGTSAILLVVAAWFSERGGLAALRWGLPAVVLIVATAIRSAGSINLMDAALLGLLPTAAFAVGRQIDRHLSSAIAPWSLALRILTGVAIMAWDTMGLSWSAHFIGGSLRDEHVRYGIARLLTGSSLLLLAVIAIAIDVAARIASRYRNAATLPS
jgi:hypothetical protein